MSVTTVTQILSTVFNIAIGVIFAYLYWRLIRLQDSTMSEMREQRISGGRPQVIVEADYRRLPEIDLVVRNVGGGPAKNISFDFSANIKSSTGFVLTDLFYLRDGMDFLAPGGEIRCLWDDMHSLEETLRDEGLNNGIRVYTQYEGMGGDTYHSDYGINPLLYQGIRNANRMDMDDLVQLLDERLPGGDEQDDSPDSAEEYEKQAEEQQTGERIRSGTASHESNGPAAQGGSTEAEGPEPDHRNSRVV